MNRRNAIILAAGTSSRFVPLSAECPKALLVVKGEVLIERQIRQLKEAGVDDITVVVGYKAELFSYLKEKYSVNLVLNEDFSRYNNSSSLIRVLDRLADSYICSSDNYFPKNVFLEQPQQSYYSALYASGNTPEYCMSVNERGEITAVSVGGRDAWYMNGHAYFSKDFSDSFKAVLSAEYENEPTRHGYWEDVYIKHIAELPPMLVRKFAEHDIEEFDSLDELRQFDESYIGDSRSTILKGIASSLGCKEAGMRNFHNLNPDINSLHFTFDSDSGTFEVIRIGGMSNKNFRVNVGGKSYVLRVPGNGSDGMVDRLNEEYNALAACKLGVNPEIRYFNADNGVKLADYVPDAETLTAQSIQDRGNMEKIADIYRKVHRSGICLRNDFNIFREIEKYEQLMNRASAIMYDGWEMLRPQVMSLEELLKEMGVENCPCHNDALYDNFIKAQDGSIYLIDWEYSGMNDPMADFAALFLEADFSRENQEFILGKYYNGNIPENSFRKILCYMILWDYLWAQWTVIKEACGDNFGSYGIDRFNRAVANMKIVYKA